MLEEVEKMKRFGKFTKENMIAQGFIDPDNAKSEVIEGHGSVTSFDLAHQTKGSV